MWYAQRTGVVCALMTLGILAVPGRGEILDAYAYLAGDDPTVYGTPVTIDVPDGGSYAGIGSQVVGLEDESGPLETEYFGSSIVLQDGVNNTGHTVTITMAWRTRTTLEVNGRPYTPRVEGDDGDLHYSDGTYALSPEGYNVASDVVSISGMEGIYVMQVEYTESDLVYDPGYDEASLAAEGWLFLGWFEGEADDPAGDLDTQQEWMPAVDKNSATGVNAVANYQGSWDDFVAAQGGSLNMADYLGSYGVDITTDTVWAVLDHNSTFGAIPEPSTAFLLAGGLMLLLRRRRRA